MRRTHVTLIIIITVVLTLLLNIMFGNYIGARLATLPLVKKWHFLQPNAPIVITNRETVRVSDANDAVETTNSLKSKISAIVYFDGSNLVQTGTALNWTADGYFITAVKSFGVQNKTYAVVLNSGDIFPVKTIFTDPSSSLVIVDTDAGSISNIDTEEDKNLRPGEKLLFIANNIPGNQTAFLESYVRATTSDIGSEFSADQIVRGADVQSVTPLLPGQPAVTLDGKMAGMWTGDKLLTSDAIRSFANIFFNDGKIVERPYFGFRYRHLTSVEAKAAQQASGAQVTAVNNGSPASLAGLQAGDTITSVNGTDIKDDTLVEALLEQIKPADRVTLQITRKGQSQTLVMTPVTLNK